MKQSVLSSFICCIILLSTTCFFFFSSTSEVYAQVNIDKPINLSGSTGNRKITNLETPVAGTDVVNKDYVDTKVATAGGIASGTILMWSGSILSIPSGWLLCNGANGTPDLRDKFVIGAGNTYAVTATGGASQVTLSVSQLPAHTHNLSCGMGNTNAYGDGPPMTSTSNSGATTKTTTSTGSGSPVSILPPYYSLAYIMKQ